MKFPMSQRHQDSKVVYLAAHAGSSRGLAYGRIQPEPEFILRDTNPYYRADGPIPVARADNSPCPLDCGDDDRREWCNVHLLEGKTRREAIASRLAGRFQGWAYRISECKMAEDRPQDNPSGLRPDRV